MKKTYRVNSAEQTEELGRTVAELLESNSISRAFIAMRGEMGVGKTAFTRGFASHFGIKNVKSPTFTVLNEYRGRVPIHHFDFYRITDEDDLYSIGFDDCIAANGYSIGEWSENVESSLPDDRITVTISRVNTGSGMDADLRDIEIDYGTRSFERK